MANLFSMINMESAALGGFQTALGTTGHNIANVNTAGYSRQTVDFVANQPLTYFQNGFQQLGQGVGVAGINRIQNDYLANSLNASSSNVGRFQSLSDGLQNVANIYNNTSSSGISSALDAFYGAWSGLAANPSDTASRTALQQAAQSLTDTVRSNYANISQAAQQTQSQIGDTINQVNTLAQQIATLNKQIQAVSSTGGSPNDLYDSRDAALNQLSSLVNVSKSVNKDGSYSVSVSGFDLVDSGGARSFPTTYNAGTGTFTDGVGTFQLQGGSLYGQMDLLGRQKSQMSNLDTLANTLRTQINTPYKLGYGLDGVTGRNFFNDSTPQTGAIDFNLDPSVQASTDAIAAGTSTKAGDGGLAQSIADSAKTALASLGNQTISGYWQANINQLSTDTATIGSQLSTETAIQTQVQGQVASVSGVNIDEEMANLQKYQQSYQAAAKALTVFDQTISDTINMLVR